MADTRGTDGPASARPVQWHAVQESDEAERLLAVLRRWTAFAEEHYEDWPGRPRCGHYFGGSYWYMGETLATCFSLAVAASFGRWDVARIGVERGVVREHVVRGLRYACFTHDTGPADCVREAGSLQYVSGRKWGGEGENFFMASQNGRSIAMLAHVALLLWDELDSETRQLVGAVVESYADKWSDEEPRTGTYYDTQCEENAWTAAGISAALVMFPGHPDSERWAEAFRRWARNVITVPSDRAKHPHGLIDKARPGSIQTVTFHPDFTAENHGFVHPAYMCAGINLRSYYLTLAAMTGIEPVPEATRNNLELYSRAVRFWTQRDGVVVPVQGQDWWYNRQHDSVVTHAVMSVFHAVAEAGLFESDAISFIEAIQASNDRGCLLEGDGDEIVLNASHGQYVTQLEFGSAADLAMAALMHLFGRPPGRADSAKADPGESGGYRPAATLSREQIETELSGVHVYPNGGVAVHRRPDSFTSFSWRNHVLAYAASKEGMWMVTPHYLSYLGSVTCATELADDAADGTVSETVIREVEDAAVTRKTDGFAVAAVVPRCEGALRQSVLFASLPDGRSIYAEVLTARVETMITEVGTGLIGVRNESYAALPELAPGRRRLYHPGGELTFDGFHGRKPDRFESIGACGWVNLDDSVGYLLAGSSGVRYQNRHQYAKWRGVEDLLTLNYRWAGEGDRPAAEGGGRRLGAGEALPAFAVVTVPNQPASATRAARSGFRLLGAEARPSAGGGTAGSALAAGSALVAELEDLLLYAWFADEPGLLRVRGEYRGPSGEPGGRSARIYSGRQELRSDCWFWSKQIETRSADYIRAPATVEIPAGEIDLLCIGLDDSMVFVNRSGSAVQFAVIHADGRRVEVNLGSGGTFHCETATSAL